MLKIGIIKEWKQPADKRTVLTPHQCEQLMLDHPQIKISVESSSDRTFTDNEYRKHGIEITTDMSDCDMLLGVKEVPPDKLIPNKTYFFFSHTIKKQPYNQKLMRALISKKIRMIDFETLTESNGKRIIGFGNFAGKVGAYNGLLTWGRKYNTFSLTPAYQINSYKGIVEEAKSKIKGDIKIVLTGTGRVGGGAYKFLTDIGLEEISPEDFLKHKKKGIWFTHLGSKQLFRRKSDKKYDRKQFHTEPELYESSFLQYANQCDLLINGIFWNSRMPRLFETTDIQNSAFKISVIADVSCDVNGSVPITYRATDIFNPAFGVSRKTLQETNPYSTDTIDMMTVTNLPTELPKDASTFFGKTFVQRLIPEILNPEHSLILDRATICLNGKLNKGYEYLKDYAAI
ncbi:MAG: NAD(P)-dependent oxidoreductase [Bacteroidia bacterium]|nr:NAD(P)-dependent oxidoreductase [Bacteroidia bacterium]